MSHAKACGEVLERAWRGRTGPSVLLMGWARLSGRAREGSGYNLSVGTLASELRRRGWRVVYLRSGMEYSLRPGVCIEPLEVFEGVPSFAVVNSPNVAMGHQNFSRPRAQGSCSELEGVVGEFLQEVKPQVVHVHSFEGFSFGVVERARQAGARVVVTPHNYFALCAQVDLFQRESAVCVEYDGGRSCESCLRMPDADEERMRRRRGQTLAYVLGPGTTASLRAAGRALARVIRGGDGSVPEVEGTAAGATRGGGVMGDGVPPGVREVPRAQQADAVEEIERGTRHLVVLNAHGERRAAGVAALNAADAVLCPSRTLMRVHRAMGVSAERLRWVRLGQPHFDRLRDEAAGLASYERVPWEPSEGRPLRLAYLGNPHPNKGLATVCRAILELPPEVRARTHWTLRVTGDVGPYRAWLSRLESLGAGAASAVSVQGGYAVEDLVGLAPTFDVGVFPNMGLDNSPFVVLEFLHAGKFVIASRLGGPTDLIAEGKTGMFFHAGDARALGACVTRLVRGEAALPTPRMVHEASTLVRFSEYVDEVERAYAVDAARR